MIKGIEKIATKDGLASVKADLLLVKSDLATFKFDLAKGISEAKADIIKWMFIFRVGQMGAMLAILLLVVKK